MSDDRPIPPGRYLHYKGKEYTVLGLARHSETEEELVVYRQEYGDRGLWVRPRRMFAETVRVNGQDIPRFRHVGPSSVAPPAVAGNVFRDLPARLPDELVQTLLTSAHVRIERILSRGHASPQGFWYDQDLGEWVAVLQGSARLRFEGDQQSVEMGQGDWVHIPAHRKHRVEWTHPDTLTLWLAVHYDPGQE